MEYISKHHHTLRNQPFAGLSGITVLLVEPEPEARAFYGKQLANMDMEVVSSDDIRTMHDYVQSSEPDVVVVNPSEDIRAGINFLKSFRSQFPDLPIITMTMTMPDDTLDAIMNAGVSLHINRGLTRPRDLLLALEQVLALK